jgi:hypothetical protein
MFSSCKLILNTRSLSSSFHSFLYNTSPISRKKKLDKLICIWIDPKTSVFQKSNIKKVKIFFKKKKEEKLDNL